MGMGFFFAWKSFVKLFRIFKLESDFSPIFFLQNHKTRKLRNLTYHVLHVCQVSGEKKNDLSTLVFLNQNSQNFTKISLIFNLKSEFFRIFKKKGPNFRKLRNLTYLELQLSQFSGKSKNLFGSSSFIIIHSFIAINVASVQSSTYLDEDRGGRSR